MRAFRWCVAVCAITIVASIGGPLIGRGTFLSVSMLRRAEPWSALTPSSFVYRLPFATDTIDSGTPARIAIRQALVEDGRIPLWNPYPNGGTQLGSTPSSGIFSPIVWPEIVLGIETGAAWAGLLRMTLAALGAFFLLRRFRLSRFAATCGGLIYCTSGFVVAWTNWPQADIAALIPFLFFTADVVLERRRAINLAAFAAVVAAMLLSGYPPLVLIILYALAGFLVVRWYESGRGLGSDANSMSSRAHAIVAKAKSAVVPAMLAVAGLGLGAALAAFQLLPFLLNVGTYDISYRAADNAQTTPSASLLTTIFPWALGGPQDARSFSVFASAEAMKTDFIEQFVFLGAAAVIFVLLAAVRGRPRNVPSGVYRYCVSGVVLLVLLLFGTRVGPVPDVGGVLRDLVALLPGVEQVPITRFVAILLFLAAILAAFGIEHVVDWAPRPFDRRFALRIAAVLLFGVYVLYTVLRSWRNVTVDLSAIASWFSGFEQRSWILRHSIVPAIILVATPIVILAARRGPRTLRAIALGSIPVLLAAEALMVTTPFWPRVPRSDYYFTTPSVDYLASHLGHERMAPAETELLFASTPAYGLRSVGGHSYFAPTWSQLLEATGTTYFQRTQLRLQRDNIDVAASPVLDRLGARYFVASPNLSAPFGTWELGPAVTGTTKIGDGVVGHGTIPGGPIRGVFIPIVNHARIRGDLVSLDVRIRDEAGNVASGSRRLYDGPPGAPGPRIRRADCRGGGPPGQSCFGYAGFYLVPVAGENLQGGAPVNMEVRLRSDAPDTARIAATSDGQVSVAVIRPNPDGLELEYADSGATIYRRLSAMPRIRWASRTKVLAGPRKRVAALAAGDIPADTVVLNRKGPVADGRPAKVTVRTDSGDKIRAEVQADGAGYVVVADGLQSGWSASVDGRSVPLVRADHALVAVPVPRGAHTIELTATPRGWRVGTLISLLALVLVVAIVAVWLVRRRRGSAPGPDPDVDPALRTSAVTPVVVGSATAGSSTTLP